MGKVGFLGAGAMAEALVAGILKAGVFLPEEIAVSDLLEARRELMREKYRVNSFAENVSLLNAAETVVLAVKPAQAKEALVPLWDYWREGQLLISIVTGLSLKTLAALVPAGIALIRVVPNTPCLVREGTLVLTCGPTVNKEQEELARRILGAVGQTFTLPESLFEAVTALSGSGPAFVYLFIEALSDAGVKAGLPREVATLLAAQTVRGAAKMVQETGRHPGELKDQVTSPGGTTIAGLEVLEEKGLRGVLMKAVGVAYQQAQELRRKGEF